MIKRFRTFLFAGLPLCLTLFSASVSTAAPTTPFPVQIKVRPCPEFNAQTGVTLEVKYTVGESTELLTPEITSLTVDGEGRRVYDLKLPRTYGAVPLNVVSFCRNSFGLSAPSDEKTVSNCDAIALLDTDEDGLPNSVEDTDCDNHFSFGDTSNPDNPDTDGDYVRDIIESLAGTDAARAGSSIKPYIFGSAPFDPDGDGDANPVVWRPSNGVWYVRDFGQSGNNIAFQFGLSGDVPIVYDPKSANSNVGVVREIDNVWHWLLRGPGFKLAVGTSVNTLLFGLFGDNLVHGPWEEAGVTNPAIARLFNGQWLFYIYGSDGTVRTVPWGGTGDIPRVQDYDGDGLFDVAVFRLSTQRTYYIESSTGLAREYVFGAVTADFSPRGNYTTDAADDVTFWEPLSQVFTSMTSDNGFDATAAAAKDPDHYQELTLGTYVDDVPLSWNRRGDRDLYTVVNHLTGVRRFKLQNNPANPTTSVQWGLPGDAQG